MRETHEGPLFPILALIEDKIDLVLLDIVLSDLGGGEIFEPIKKLDPGAKVVLISGDSFNKEATAMLERGCSGFIHKQFAIEELSAKIVADMNRG